jgi:enediyne biosynthesis protein E4
VPVETLNKAPLRASKRIRRVIWTAAALCVLVGVAALMTWRIRKDNRPDEYTPGEQSQDVTNISADRLVKPSTSPAPVTRTAVTGRRIDHLLDPGKKLPAGAPQPLFTDVTKEAGLGGYREFQGSRTSQLPEDMGAGVAWGDFDNDGLEDLFVVSGGGPLNAPTAQLAPSILYRNLGNGGFEKVKDFPDLRIHGMAAAWGDYNNDGWLDLVVSGYDTIMLFRNDHGHLVRDTSFTSPKGFWAGVSWGDYNRDGYLDLYVCGYVRYKPEPGKDSSTSTQFGMEVPFTLNPASYEPERNLLFRNNGNGKFTELAKEAGVANADGRSLVAIWHDFDGDGWPDLYVANDISENKLYLNRHGKFVDAGKDAWVEEYRGSMGLAVADFDRDGDDDLFISHWIAQGFALYQNLLEEQRDKSGKSELHFTDVAATSGIGEPSMRSVGWGTSFVDIDSDGWPDLLVANGSTFEEKTATPRRLSPMPSFLFWNAEGQLFHNLAPWNRSFSEPHASRGLAVADYNNDGAVDVAIVDQGDGVRLLRNDLAQGNWIELRLHDRVPPTNTPLGFGDGATVIAWVKGVPFRRTVSSSSYLSQDSRRIHIGLGSSNHIDRLDVHWSRGRSETWTNVSANRFWDVTQGEAALRAFVPGSVAGSAGSDTVSNSRSTILQFWSRQHAAMDAMKRERDFAKAAMLFREALALNPNHEDSHYYLANCYALQGNIPAAIGELDALTRINPQNHRAFQRKGELMAAVATSRTQLSSAREALLSALRLNSEETGTLVLLGEVDLGRGEFKSAETTLEHVCQANTRAANGWYFRGYLAWKRHDADKARTMLNSARRALGPDWKPTGSVLEGDVRKRMFSESGFLGVFAEQWNGQSDPTIAYAGLDAYIRRLR